MYNNCTRKFYDFKDKYLEKAESPIIILHRKNNFISLYDTDICIIY